MIELPEPIIGLQAYCVMVELLFQRGGSCSIQYRFLRPGILCSFYAYSVTVFASVWSMQRRLFVALYSILDIITLALIR